MDHLDTKWLSFVINLVLHMHQFQKYQLLNLEVFVFAIFYLAMIAGFFLQKLGRVENEPNCQT